MSLPELKHLNLNLLYTFQAFASHGSVAATAKALGRSQPAISARLHQFEEELGIPLFERSGRRLHLTPVGRAIQSEAEILLGGIHRIFDRAQGSEHEPAGLLRIGALTTVGVFVLAPALSRLLQAYPAVRCEAHHGLADIHLRRLLNGQLDLVAGVGAPPTMRQLDVSVLGTTSPVLVSPSSAKKRPACPVAPELLQEQELLGYGRIGDPFFDQVWSFLDAHALTRRIRLEVSNIEMLKALVSAGAGVTILPEYTVREGPLEVRRIEGLDFEDQIWFATRRSARRAPLVERLSQMLCEQASPGASS